MNIAGNGYGRTALLFHKHKVSRDIDYLCRFVCVSVCLYLFKLGIFLFNGSPFLVHYDRHKRKHRMWGGVHFFQEIHLLTWKVFLQNKTPCVYEAVCGFLPTDSVYCLILHILNVTTMIHVLQPSQFR